jgi:acetyltransferase-like isoleucine patch superfamily enzyme
MKKIKRIVLLPFGLIKKLLEVANEGARDIENKLRFKNAIIDKGCSFDSKSKLHPNVHVLENCIINNSEINSYTYLGKNCLVQNTTIGKFCSIANEVLIGLGAHPIDNFSTSPLFYRKKNTFNINLIDKDLDFVEYKKTTIKNDVWIGARVIILDGVTIGNGAIIASGSVVTKDVVDYTIVAGVPAKVIKNRVTDSKIKELLELKWWEWDLEKIKTYYNL